MAALLLAINAFDVSTAFAYPKPVAIIKSSDNSIESYEFFYDEEKADMRINNSSDQWKYLLGESKGDWVYLYPPLNWSLDGCRPARVGEAVFYVSQGRKFYGNYTWNPLLFDRGVYYMTDDYDPQYVDIFKDEFYEKL